MSEQRPGNSGVFRAIVDSAKKLKRAVTGGDDDELDPKALELGERIARAFVTGKLEEVHAMGSPGFQQRMPKETFVARWREAVNEREALTGYEISSAGFIELEFVPGLEEVPQSNFLGFVQITFSDPVKRITDEGAFTIGAVLVVFEGIALIGALHKR